MGFLIKLLGGLSPKTWGMLFLVLSVGGYVGYLKFQEWHLHNKVEQLKIENKQLQVDVEFQKGEVKACKAKIDAINQHISDLKDDSKARQDIIDLLANNLKDFKENSQTKIDNIKNSPTPQTCEEAMEFLREGLKQLK